MSNFLAAAHHTDRLNPLPHQDAAWHWAWECLTADEQQEFLDLFRAAVASKQEPTANSWTGVIEGARRAGARYPELVAAQWAVESAWGKQMSGKWNAFGLKAASGGTPCPTVEIHAGMAVHEVAYFMDFKSLQEAIEYLVSRWYKDYQSYKGVNGAADREEAARLLQKEGYCTDPGYARKLIELVNQHSPRPQPTQAIVQKEATLWRTKVAALNLSQPDGRTCQAACIGMAVGDRDIVGIRAKLASKGIPGDPGVMAQVIGSYPVSYRYEANASLNQVNAWLKQGELLITHGWFTSSGHVIVLDGVEERPDGSYAYDVKDPWSEFNGGAWAYTNSSKFFDGFYSEALVYAACVAGTSRNNASAIYQKRELQRNRGGMWVHRFTA